MIRFFDILQWTIVAAMVVIVVTNGSNVASLITSFGNFWTRETGILATGKAA